MIRPSVVAAALGVASFVAGWSVHALLTPAEPRPAGPSALPSAPLASPAVVTMAQGPASSQDMRDVFDSIYREARWGTNAEDAGTSGLGSTLSTTLLYRTFLQKFMKEAGVRSVVDAGCGDWEFSSAVDWTGIDYKGYDIVPSVIEKDKSRYTQPNVHFFVADVVGDELPPADLLICKHVLQHLQEASVQKFLAKLPAYKHSLIVDSVEVGTLSSKNPDIQNGAFRPLDITKPPYNVRGAKLLTYWDGANMQQVVHIAGPRQ